MPAHKEAFALMWYGCECGHRERYWNSRDGVTPFMTLCPSCDQPTLQHVWWTLDAHTPDHKPAKGQRVWVDMTRERAEQYARSQIAQMKARGYEDPPPETFAAIVDDLFRDGDAPDMIVTGYEWKPVAE